MNQEERNTFIQLLVDCFCLDTALQTFGHLTEKCSLKLIEAWINPNHLFQASASYQR